MFEMVKSVGVAAMFSLFAANPSSTNFTLKSYDLGAGGSTSSSTSYSLQSALGELSGTGQDSATYGVDSGVIPLQQANVPPAPTFVNPSSEYNRLRITINTGSNPTDTLYQIAISPDSFATTYYVQTDNTVGVTNTIAQYQSYTAWGSGTGVWVTGLTPSTTYQVKVRALQGDYTGSAYSPVASAATVGSSLTFSVTTSLTPTPPFSIQFSGLAAGAVTNGSATAEINFSTNAINGGGVYVRGNGSLTSASASSSIPSATANLTAASSGYGAIVSSVSQTSGGPFTSSVPFNGTLNNVGALTTSLQQIVSASAGVTGGTASIVLKAKVDAITPSASDYTDTLTFIASML